MEKDKTETTEGFFVGKELVKKGNKDGRDWTMYKVKFKPRMDAEKGFSFTVFAGLKAKNTKQLEELKEGEQYKILYSERAAVGPQGQPYVAKNAYGFYSVDVVNTNTLPNNPAPALKPDLSKFDSFAGKYKEKLKQANLAPNAVHMLGSYIANTEKVRYADLIAKCKEALK